MDFKGEKLLEPVRARFLLPPQTMIFRRQWAACTAIKQADRKVNGQAKFHRTHRHRNDFIALTGDGFTGRDS